MLERVRAWLAAVGWRVGRLADRLHRFERRELRQLRRHIERTRTLVHLSVLLLVPPLVGVLVALTLRVEALSFLLFPPLAAGTYSLFSNPESEQSSPQRFVAGLTVGGLCAWAAVAVADVVIYPDVPASALSVDAPGAALAVFLTGAVTWALDVEEPAAYAVALLGLLVPGQQFPFVLSVFASATLAAGVFSLWRALFYERRATYLYESTQGDDHVLVPLRGETADATAMLGARLAAAHDAGKVVLLDLVDETAVAADERAALGQVGPTEPGERAETTASETGGATVESTVTDLEDLARRIETRAGVPCEVLVSATASAPATTVLEAAADANCDLLCVPYESEYGAVTPFVRRLFRGDVDVVLHRSRAGRTRWRRVLVPVRGASDVAHSMVDFALRLAGASGRVSVANCIRTSNRRRRADAMLADLVEPFEGPVETRVIRASIERFLGDHAGEYDLVCIGASRDRSAASRLISPPTFERIQDVDADVAVVDRS